MGSACTSTSTSSAQLPEWLTGPASATIARSVTESQRGYTPYTAGRVAQINPTQQQGIDVLRASQGNWGAQFGDAQSDLWAARDAPGAMEAGRGFVDTAANASGHHAARGYLDTAAGMSSLDAASPLIESGTGAGGLATASPFLAAASQTAPSALSAYMSPYQSGVVDEIGRLGSRNLTENILPKINDTFIGSGQFGSDRNANTIGKAIRDTSRDIAGQQSAALQAGYGQAGQLFTSDANRQAALAGTAGNLGESAAGRDLTGASLAANATNADAGRILQAGTTVGSLVNTDAARSLEAGRTVAGFAGQDQAAALANSRQSAALAGQQQTQNITDANALMAAGGVQQQTAQRGADAAFEEAMRGQNFNRDQLTWLNSIIRGTPYGQTTTQTQQPSLWSVLGFRDGGRVPALALGGRPSWYDDEYDYEEEEDDGYMGGGYGGGGGRRRGWAKSAQAFIKPPRDKPGLLGRMLSASKFIPGLADGGYVDDEEEDDLFPAAGAARDALSRGDEVRLPYFEPDEDPDDYRGVPGMRALPHDGSEPKVQLLAEAPPPSALSLLRDRATKKGADDPDLKAAMAGVDAAQKAALAPRPAREESWMDSPLAVGAAGFLAAPKGTGVLGRVGHGALEAVTRRQTQRRLDQSEDQARRMESLKVAQQRLSNILSMRTADTTSLGQLARAEALQARGSQPKQTTAMAEAAAMGFDLATPEGRTNYQKWKIGQTRAPQGEQHAPLDIEKAQRIIDNPNASPELKDAARRLLGAKGNRDLTPAQIANLRASAAKLAQADVAGLGKDFQFKTPEEQQAFLQSRTDAHLKWLREGSDPDAAPAVAAPQVAPAPAPAGHPAPPRAAAPAPAAPEDPLAEATPEELQRIATDPQYPADPAMREAAKAKLAAAAPVGATAAPPAPKAAPSLPGPRADRVRDVPAPMVNAMSTNAQSIRQIDKALAALKEYPQGVGADIGAYNLLPGPALDKIDPKGTTLRALVADIGSLKIHDRSGAAVTAAEFPRLKPFVPNIWDDDKTVAKKLAQFRSAYMEILADQYGAYGPAAGHKANQRIEDVLNGTAAPGGDGEKKTPEQRAAAMLAARTRPEGVGKDWKPRLHKSSGLMGWASPDGRTFIPAE